MKAGYFVTGTDTGVGKTIVTAAILRSFIKKGLKVGAMKVIETGCINKDGILLPSDGMFLRDMAEMNDSIDLITPVKLENPLSPLVASRLENIEIDIDQIFKSFEVLKKKYDYILVEGVGGLMVPLFKQEKKKVNFYFVRDLIKDLELPAIIVTRPTLGTINHTLLTVEALKNKKIPIKGYIINFSESARNDIAEKTNPEILRELLDIPCLGVLPYLTELNKDKIGETALKHIDIETLIQL
ncbi:dethiobiotin synthetase [Thermodesulfovibrio aggregans]|uniref:ATP-dependent dethiobiotin synthetase BioD n=1 Tax=Thermodesulfovibrio aggregans TaxID=86166 RepID=A0A0U9HNU4_9BACT|nr:dethiobiotin synthase [Thermodesulfovibrio aggregans]GAQ94667.1 dethiobiotin synthetase [Thermodesulfovibrio aggregans]